MGDEDRRKAGTRAARLEAELRANLKKRKEQARARARATASAASGGSVASDPFDAGGSEPNHD